MAILISITSCNRAVQLFQEDTANWETHGSASWTFSNNTLIAEVDDGSGFVMTKETFKNFMLELEFKPDSTINSGVFIRCAGEEPPTRFWPRRETLCSRYR